jgi:hypothetical protein
MVLRHANSILSHRWLTLGNQLGPDQIYEEELAARIKARSAVPLVLRAFLAYSFLANRYPERTISAPAVS